MHKFKISIFAAFCAALIIFGSADSIAAPLPGSADAGRVSIDHKPVVTESAPTEEMQRMTFPGAEVPKGANNVKLKLRKVILQGNTAFSNEELAKLYSGYLDKEVSLDTIWKIADNITQHYQDAGYFLSRAFIPQQEIGDTITIKIVEGYVGEVELKDPLADHYIIKSMISELEAERPARIQTMESLLLKLNDLPGVSFRSVLDPINDSRKNDGAVKIVLIKENKPSSGQLTFDNYSSRYLGPYEGTLTYQASLLPLQTTTMSVVAAAPPEKLKYFNLSHDIPITPDISMQIYGGYNIAHPGYTLSPKDIESDASNIGFSVKDQFIRQRQENLSTSFIFDGKDNYSNVLDAPLSRDRIRAARVNVSYDRNDPLDGYDYLTFTGSKGVPIFDASPADEKLLSRAGAKPDFTKAEATITRFQTITESWTAVTAVTGQVASGVLYSAEQFGYGGQQFGRAYDPSEFTGDDGLAGSLEVRYQGIPTFETLTLAPYGFYDIGMVWNRNSPSESGASAGLGLRFDSTLNLTGNLTVAQPLTRPLEDPESGNGKNPRYLFQISYKF